jgi:hypothetical protein
MIVFKPIEQRICRLQDHSSTDSPVLDEFQASYELYLDGSPTFAEFEVGGTETKNWMSRPNQNRRQYVTLFRHISRRFVLRSASAIAFADPSSIMSDSLLDFIGEIAENLEPETSHRFL